LYRIILDNKFCGEAQQFGGLFDTLQGTGPGVVTVDFWGGFLSCPHFSRAVTFGTFRRAQMGSLNETGAVTLGAFAGDLLVTITTPAVMHRRTTLDVEDFSATLFTFQPGHLICVMHFV
jgi:hypothetical protein